MAASTTETERNDCLTVLGAGAWGTALAVALVRNGQRVRLWGHDPAHLQALADQRENQRHLAGVALPADLEIEPDLARASADTQALIVATPSHTVRDLLTELAATTGLDRPLLLASKGVEPDTFALMHEIVADVAATAPTFGVVSGPSFAREVGQGLPTALTVASTDADFAARAVGWLHGGGVRAYSSPDVIGVELGGALKNVLAIACGAADGLGFGANARAAVITRGLAECMRLGTAMGGQAETFTGLAGMGDLVLTCTDDQSRNRRLGLALARGLTLEAACAEIGQAVEGVRTARAAMALARRHAVDMPIVEEVSAVLHAGRDPRAAVAALLERHPKDEIPHP